MKKLITILLIGLLFLSIGSATHADEKDPGPWSIEYTN